MRQMQIDELLHHDNGAGDRKTDRRTNHERLDVVTIRPFTAVFAAYGDPQQNKLATMINSMAA